MGGAAEHEVPELNTDLLKSSLLDEDQKDSGTDLKGSMFGWVDAGESQGVVFSKAEVYVHPTAEAKDHIGGFLSVVKDNGEFFVHWTPRSMVDVPAKVISKQPSIGDNTPMKREGSFKAARLLNKSRIIEGPLEVSHKYATKVAITQIHSLRKYIPSIGYSYLIINTADGVSHPPFFFHEGGLKEFLTVFFGVAHISKSNADPNVMLVNDRTDALARTLSELQLSTSSPALSSPPATSPVAETPTQPPPPPPRRESLNKISRDPTFSIFGGFAKVTQAARELSTTLFDAKSQQNARNSISEERKKLLLDYENFRKKAPKPQPQQNVLDHSQETSTPVGVFEVLSSETTFPIEESVRTQPLTPERWYQYFDVEGCIRDVAGLKKEIFLGGVHPDIRMEVWKFLLGFFPFDSTEAERDYIRQQKKEEYETIKKQWTSITPMQEQYFSKFRERRHRIEKDVVRTDRNLPYYEDEEGEHLKMLNDILVTYTFFNFDLGYVQGMNDLLSPILFLMNNESEAFWCFVGFMDTMRHNFDKDQHGMHHLLETLRKILEVLDPQLYKYFEGKDCLNMFFCFRWLLLDFKRELAFDDVLTFWEVVWANPLTPQFPLFVSIAALQQHKNHIMTKGLAFDDILKYINDLSMNLDLQYLLKEAEILFYKFKKSANTPELAALISPAS